MLTEPNRSPHENESRLRLAINATGIGTWDLNPLTGEMVCSERCHEIFGVPVGGKTDWETWVSCLHPEDRESTLELIRRSFDKNGSGRYKCEYRIYRIDTKALRWLEAEGQAFFDASGQVVRFVGAILDVTDRKRNETELQEAIRAAESANLAKSHFLANISHEIRTPLGAILGFSELLQEPNLPEVERDLFIETIQRNGRQLTLLINDLLDLSKAEAGRIDFEKIEFSLPELLCDVCTSLLIAAREKSIELRVESEGLIPERIQSDPTRLRQILLNIVGNAIKFTSEGEVKMKVKFSGGPTPQVRFEVLDTGCGIPDEQRRRLFRPFSQGDSSTTRQYGGTGLGLALSRKLARALGGDTVLESSSEKGSCFVVTVDAGEASLHCLREKPDLCPESPQRKPIERTRSLEGIRVLVADDAADNRFLVSRSLSAQGAQVVSVENGLQAVERALQQDFDLILMDVQMPALDGLSATEELRGRGYQKPIVALTAYAMREEIERCLKSGCNSHLTKPVRLQTLVEAVEKFGRGYVTS